MLVAEKGGCGRWLMVVVDVTTSEKQKVRNKKKHLSQSGNLRNTVLESGKYRMLEISNLVGESRRKGVVADVTELQILY